MKTSLKMKLGIMLTTFLAVMSFIIMATFWVNSLQKGSGLIINLSGRQRMLSQKMTKEILGIVREKEGYGSGVNYRESLAKTREMFDMTLSALISGGETIDGNGGRVTLKAASDQEIQKILTDCSVLWKEFDKKIGVILGDSATPDSEDFKTALAFIESNNANLLKSMNDVTGMYEKEAEKSVLLLKRLQIGSLLLTLVLVIASFLMANSMIMRPLQGMAGSLSDVAGGDLTGELKAESNDEIGKIAGTMNEMTSSLRTMIKEIGSSSQKVASASSQISSASDDLASGTEVQSAAIERTSSAIEEMNASIRETAASTANLTATSEEASASTLEIAASIDEVAKIAEELSYTVEEVSSSITEMAASVREITGHASQLSAYTTETAAVVSEINASIGEVERNLNVSASLSEATASAAEAGMDAVRKTIKGMNSIKDTVEEAAGVIKSLGGKSEAIGNILNVINDVAEQTNLLALNAAIIAAQAGEHGKGFAVVADEIKELADRTTASTKEIESLIKSVQTEAANAVKYVEAGGKSVEAGVSVSQMAGGALENIMSSANASRQMVEQIARASAEQLRGSQQATEAMEKISDMISKVYKAIEDQEKGSAYIAKASERMKDAATQVKRATKEQSKGGELISMAMENISGMFGSIHRATQEEAKAGQEIVRALEEMKEITGKNIESVNKFKVGVETLTGQTDVLNNAVKKFKV